MNKKYAWVDDMSKNDLLEFINVGDPFQFQFNCHDYYIEGSFFDNDALGRVGSYMIADPNVQPNGDYGYGMKYYDVNGKFKNSQELLSAKFLDGKTILEQYKKGNLKFFD